MKYRKKPIVIEAIQYDGLNKEEIEKFVGMELRTSIEELDGGQGQTMEPKTYIYIDTLEGELRADPGDYVIKGVNGEFYPCKPYIFEKTYEPAE